MEQKKKLLLPDRVSTKKLEEKKIFLERNFDRFPLRIGKKAKMPTITPLSNIMIQELVSKAREQQQQQQKKQNTHTQKERERTKRKRGKGKKLSFAANIIMHIENPKEYTDKH